MTKLMSVGADKRYKESLQGSGGGLQLSFGAGFASNDKFTFNYQEDADGTETVRIARNDASENKPIAIGKGKSRVFGAPIAFVKNPGTDNWDIVVGIKRGDRMLYKQLPYEDVKDDVKVNYGNFELDEFLKKSVPTKYSQGINVRIETPEERVRRITQGR
jgi:hypothetical protein